MYYQIREHLTECAREDLQDHNVPYVAYISRSEFEEQSRLFDMGIDLGIEDLGVTQVAVNNDSLTGCFAVPNIGSTEMPMWTFTFAIDERGIAFINDDGYAMRIIDRIKATKRWKSPSLERFIYDFLEGIVSGGRAMVERYEKEMDNMEDALIAGEYEGVMERLVDIRSELLDLHTHYAQLIDLGQELAENENGFFLPENLRFFHLFIERTERLRDMVTALKDHTMQVRDLYNAQLEAKQNQKMSVLTIIAAIFTPLTLITSWYGMNFQYMPELSRPYAYPVLVLVCIVIVVGSIIGFKRHHWF